MNKTQNDAISKILASLQDRSSFLVATHVRPDGDAVGSLLAMVGILRRMGKKADPYSQDPASAAYCFLPGSETIRHTVSDLSVYDAAVLVDCGDIHRVGSELEASVRQLPCLINIDHHLNEAPYGTVFWVKPEASSTCEMLYDLATSIPVAVDQEVATFLYTGLITDTGSFRFSNTTERVLEIARELVKAGADPAFIAEQVYDSSSPERIQLLSRVLTSVRFLSRDRLATAELSLRMLQETSTSAADSESFINHLRSVKPVEIAMLFKEENDGLVNVSMRSKGEVDVATFAQSHGGGGHRHAAAFRVRGHLNDIRLQYTQKALEYLNHGAGM
jgi:bifunctional oligoribonuclease and PAP phosphatase NrnA